MSLTVTTTPLGTGIGWVVSANRGLIQEYASSNAERAKHMYYVGQSNGFTPNIPRRAVVTFDVSCVTTWDGTYLLSDGVPTDIPTQFSKLVISNIAWDGVTLEPEATAPIVYGTGE